MTALHSIVEDIRKLFKPEPLDHIVDGRAYAIDRDEHGPTLGELIVPPAPPVLSLSSLTGFIDAWKADIDGFSRGPSAIHVVDYRTVSLCSIGADDYGRRHEWLRATNAETNPFAFDQYQTPENFLLNLQAGFLPTENVISLQRLASSLTSENSVGVADDGLSQVITVKQGTVTREAVTLPPRIPLYAYRTFREVDPVASEFMVRLKGAPGAVPTIALLQIDAGKWKHDTQLAVARYLKQALPDAVVIA